MLISTKGRYALQVMCDLLAHDSGDFVPLKEIAARQDACMACSLWAGLQDAIDGYLDGITLETLLERTRSHRKESDHHGKEIT